MFPAIVAASVMNAVSSTQNANGRCVTCDGAVKMTSRGRWAHRVPPKDKHPVRLAQ